MNNPYLMEIVARQKHKDYVGSAQRARLVQQAETAQPGATPEASFQRPSLGVVRSMRIFIQSHLVGRFG